MVQLDVSSKIAERKKGLYKLHKHQIANTLLHKIINTTEFYIKRVNTYLSPVSTSEDCTFLPQAICGFGQGFQEERRLVRFEILINYNFYYFQV